jgi:tetratricopeptide (TPR) repeat protein
MRKFLLLAVPVAAIGVLAYVLWFRRDPAEPVRPAAETPPAETPPAPLPKSVKLLVVPFGGEGRVRDTEDFSLGFAAFLTERFERAGEDKDLSKKLVASGLSLTTVAGPAILTEVQVGLRDEPGKPFDEERARQAALAASATHVLTGSYSGRVEKFQVTVRLYEVTAAQDLTLVGEGTAGPGSIFSYKAQRPGMQMGDLHALLGEATAAAFAAASMPLPSEAVARLKTPQTPDALSYLEYARALRRHFRPLDPSKHRTAVEFAAHAVSVWPDYLPARRFYAWLLWNQGDLVKAQTHYLEILEPSQKAGAPKRLGDPDDLRALTMLGRIELELGHADEARKRLEKLSSFRPEDSEVRYWLGTAYAALGRRDEAIASMEKSRDLGPNDMRTRKALAGLYADARRYAAAADELEAVVRKETKNLEALLLLAACRRAAGQHDLALAVYALGEARFPEEAGLARFRSDLAASSGVFDPDEGLIALIPKAEALRKGMEIRRSEAVDFANDAAMELDLRGKDACVTAEPSAKGVVTGGNAYLALGASYQDVADSVRTSLKAGDAAALTPDEIARVEAVMAYAESSGRDLRQLRDQFRDTVRPLLSRYGCETDLTKVADGDIAAVRARNQARSVTLPEPKLASSSGLAPEIPEGVQRPVKFCIDNTAGTRPYVLILDGGVQKLEIPIGEKPIFATSFGYHDYCLLPEGDPKACGEQGTLSHDLIHEGWCKVIR